MNEENIIRALRNARRYFDINKKDTSSTQV